MRRSPGEESLQTPQSHFCKLKILAPLANGASKIVLRHRSVVTTIESYRVREWFLLAESRECIVKCTVRDHGHSDGVFTASRDCSYSQLLDQKPTNLDVSRLVRYTGRKLITGGNLDLAGVDEDKVGTRRLNELEKLRVSPMIKLYCIRNGLGSDHAASLSILPVDQALAKPRKSFQLLS